VDKERVHIASLALDPLTMREAVHRICSLAMGKNRHAKIVATANAQFAQIAGTNPHFHDILHRAEIVVADGMSIVGASRLLRHPLPERVAGIDLVKQLCCEAAKADLSVYFLGGKPRTAIRAAQNLKGEIASLRVVGADCPPFGFEHDSVESAAVIRRISNAAPDILFVGLGAPKQEYWMEAYSNTLPVKVMIGVGCTFDVLSGDLPRAPLWMQHAGLEWLFRLAREPGRLWRRYLVGNARFVEMVLWQWLTGKREV
jgi:N-acetylglucosaminyldiphosphoundecaprenol N-acetyl-beta-D-mannosaminyltransferase